MNECCLGAFFAFRNIWLNVIYMFFYLWKYFFDCYLRCFCLCFKCLKYHFLKKIKITTVLITSISSLLVRMPPKEIVQSFIDLVNMAKWLMDENQQLWVIQELGRLLPSIRGGGRRGESSELPRVGAGKSSVSATDIILVRHGFPQHGQLKKYGDQKQHQRNRGYLCRIKKLMLLREIYQRNHVPNYASGNSLGTK